MINNKHIKTLLLAKKQILFLFALLLFLCSYAEAQQLNFAFLTDLHVSPGSENEEALRKMVEDINRNDFDFVVVTGDLTNTGANAELQSVKAALDNLNKPLLIIPGNHETNWSESAGLLFGKLWGNDRFLFRKNGFLLVGFNTGPFMKMGDGHVKQEDIQWLKRVLDEKKEEKLIAFSHYPIADGLDNWTDISDLLKKHNCLISFCGHGHKFSLLNFDNIPGVMGRALKDKKGFGYNIVTINENKAIVSEKLLSAEIQPFTMEIDLASPDKLNGLTVSPKPDFSINTNSRVRKSFEMEDTVSIFTGPCIVGDSMVIYGNSTGWIKAVRIKNKTIAWQKQFTGSIYSNPVFTSGIVSFGTADGFVKGLDLKTGQEVWSVNAGRPVLAEALPEKGYIYIGGGDNAFYKIDATSGRVVWSFTGIKGSIQGKPAISGKNVVFGAWDTHFYCLDKQTGTLRWKWNNGKINTLLSPGNIVPAISKNKVFIVAPDRFFTALDINTGTEIWRTGRFKVRESMGVSPDGKYIYAKLMNDSLICISANSGSFAVQWAINAGTGYDHNPCPVESNGEIVAIATKNGLVVAIDEKNRNIHWKYKYGNSSINKMVFQKKGGKLWLTTTDGKIVSLTYKH